MLYHQQYAIVFSITDIQMKKNKRLILRLTCHLYDISISYSSMQQYSPQYISVVNTQIDMKNVTALTGILL